jgi:hypothetical protein
MTTSAEQAVEAAITDALTRAEAETWTKQPPKDPAAQMRLVVKNAGGSTKAAAARLGISQRQVERYLTRTARRPRPALTAALNREVARIWQPRIRGAALARAATQGITIALRASFGYEVAGRKTDQARERLLRLNIPAQQAAAIITAHQQQTGDKELRVAVARALQEEYFQERGTRAQNLEITINDIDFIDVLL